MTLVQPACLTELTSMRFWLCVSASQASSPRQPGDIFTLEYDGSMCTAHGYIVSSISFMFNMFSGDWPDDQPAPPPDEMGKLSVVTADGRRPFTWSGRKQYSGFWSKGAAYNGQNIGINSASFRFEYERGSGYRGDAAIDQVSVFCGRPPPSSANFTFDEAAPFPGWTTGVSITVGTGLIQEWHSTFPFILGSGETPTDGTGPEAAYSPSSSDNFSPAGSYYYAEVRNSQGSDA